MYPIIMTFKIFKTFLLSNYVSFQFFKSKCSIIIVYSFLLHVLFHPYIFNSSFFNDDAAILQKLESCFAAKLIVYLLTWAQIVVIMLIHQLWITSDFVCLSLCILIIMIFDFLAGCVILFRWGNPLWAWRVRVVLMTVNL